MSVTPSGAQPVDISQLTQNRQELTTRLQAEDGLLQVFKEVQNAVKSTHKISPELADKLRAKEAVLDPNSDLYGAIEKVVGLSYKVTKKGVLYKTAQTDLQKTVRSVITSIESDKAQVEQQLESINLALHKEVMQSVPLGQPGRGRKRGADEAEEARTKREAAQEVRRGGVDVQDPTLAERRAQDAQMREVRQERHVEYLSGEGHPLERAKRAVNSALGKISSLANGIMKAPRLGAYPLVAGATLYHRWPIYMRKMLLEPNTAAAAAAISVDVAWRSILQVEGTKLLIRHSQL